MDKMWHKVTFKQSKTGLNSDFSFSKTVANSRLRNSVYPSSYLELGENR